MTGGGVLTGYEWSVFSVSSGAFFKAIKSWEIFVFLLYNK